MTDLWIWVVRWPEFQHYKPNPARGPAWIKQHTAQLADGRYLALNHRQRSTLHDLRMLFAHMRARLPHDRAMIGALRNAETRQADIDALVHAGLVEVVSRETLEHRLEHFFIRSRAEVEVEKERDLKPPPPQPSTYNGEPADERSRRDLVEAIAAGREDLVQDLSKL